MKALELLISQGYLSQGQSAAFMQEIFDEKISDVEISAVLSVLRYKKESSDEIVGLCESLIEQLEVVPEPIEALDMCGTGGDGLDTFNISTAAAILCSSLGISVAKHGNRKVSSKSGSADVLEALGINIDCGFEEAHKQLAKNQFTFLFAPNYHQSFSKVKAIRQTLKMRTVFNLLGPLLNPLRPKYQLIGVFAPELVEVIAQSLLKLGVEKGIVVSSENGMDEFSLHENCQYAIVENQSLLLETFRPYEFFGKIHSIEELKGGGPEENAQIICTIDHDVESAPAKVVAINAAAGMMAAKKVNDLQEGYTLAIKALSDGRYRSQLNKLRGMSFA